MATQINSKLTTEQKKIMFEHGTEAPFSGKYYLNNEDGIYHCANCDNPLFDSREQFDSGCGWPSFKKPITAEAVSYRIDKSYDMIRTEVLCGNCGASLGHVFTGELGPGTQRYCINSAVFDFKKGDK